MTQRVFMPDMQKPNYGRDRLRWQVGDVWCFYHGPHLCWFEVTELTPCGMTWRTNRLVNNPHIRFKDDIKKYIKRLSDNVEYAKNLLLYGDAIASIAEEACDLEWHKE
jgi:hypothetical protein